jgi:hypothetical protein
VFFTSLCDLIVCCFLALSNNTQSDYLSLYLFIYGMILLFQVLASMNRATANFQVQVFVLTCFKFIWIDSREHHCWVIQKKFQVFVRNCHTIFQCVWIILLFHIFANIWDFGYFNRLEWYQTILFLCNSPMIYVKHLFMCLFAMCIFFGEVSIFIQVLVLLPSVLEFHYSFLLPYYCCTRGTL